MEKWADLRRLHFVEGISIREIARRTGLDRKTIRKALRAEARRATSARRERRSSTRSRTRSTACCARSRRLPATRISELLGRWATTGARRSSTTTCARSARSSPRRRAPSSARSIARASSASSTSGSPRKESRSASAKPVGLGRRRLPGLLARRRRRARLLQAGARHPVGHRAVPVAARRPAGDARLGSRGRPARRRGPPQRGLRCLLRPAAGSAGTFAQRADPQAKGVVERLQGYLETSFEPGRRFANELDFQDQLDAWFESAPTCASTARFAAGRRPPGRGARGDGAAARPGRPISTAAGAARAARPLRARRHQRLLARPAPGRPARRGARLPGRDLGVALDTGELASAIDALRPPPHPHRARARRALRALRAPSAAPSPRSSPGRSPATTP